MANFLMKGKVWAEHKHKLKYPVAAEVKYDEIRLHVKRAGDVVEFLSYEGKPLHNLDGWQSSFLFAMKESNTDNLDMGVLVNGNFNDSFRWCRTTTGFPAEKFDKKAGKTAPALHPDMVEFYLFDLPDYHSSYNHRVCARENMANLLSRHQAKTKTPVAVRCSDEDAVNQAFAEFRSLGHEGAMIKSLSHTYQIGKRIDGWLKMKPDEEADGKVVGFNEAISEDGAPLGRVGSFEVDVEDGSHASPAAGITHEFAKLIWENQADYLAAPCVFKYMERDRAGGYRHPIFGRFRESKGLP